MRKSSSVLSVGFGRFLVWSLLWHAGQLTLFTTIFKIKPPEHGAHVLNGEDVQVQSIQLYEDPDPVLETRVIRVPVEAQSSTEEATAFKKEEEQSFLPLRQPKRMKRETRLGPSKLKALDREKIKGSPFIAEQSPESGQKNYVFSQTLKKRRLLFQPPLPDYPESLREQGASAGVDLSLHVRRNGSVKRVNIARSSGDFKTDLIVKAYAKALVFEASSLESEGTMSWSFELE